jgi:hypothetical protein
MPRLIKAEVHTSRTKPMILAFFGSKGLIYTNYVPRGTTMNANCIMEALGKFLKIFKQKRPEMRSGTGGSTGIILRCTPLPW